MPQKTFTARAGAVLADVRLPSGAIRITTDPRCRAAQITVRTSDDTGAAADAVRGARIEQRGDEVHVDVPELAGVNVIVSGRGATVVNNFGSVVVGGRGTVIVNGNVVTAGGAVSALEVDVVLPAGSSARLDTHNADTVVTGGLDSLEAHTHNGGLRADRIGRLKWRGHNSGVRVGALAQTVDVDTHNGSIDVDRYAGSDASFSTHNGAIYVAATPVASGRLDARSHNGTIRLRGAEHLKVRASGRNW